MLNWPVCYLYYYISIIVLNTKNTICLPQDSCILLSLSAEHNLHSYSNKARVKGGLSKSQPGTTYFAGNNSDW